jgi:hypothetical protein
VPSAAARRASIPDGLSVSDELARRGKRLSKLAEARAKIEARALKRFEHEHVRLPYVCRAQNKAEAHGR